MTPDQITSSIAVACFMGAFGLVRSIDLLSKGRKRMGGTMLVMSLLNFGLVAVLLLRLRG